MPAQTIHLDVTQDLALLLGPRQADIMRLLWSRGPATVRELHTYLMAKTPLAYTTVMSICLRLMEKGLLERRYVTAPNDAARHWNAYVYTPRISEAEFTRAAVEQRIAPVLTHYPALMQEQVAGVPPRRSNGTIGSDRA